ncbi:hypothetical protein [Paenibacillus harenae]|uniref:phage adaptor protein n=1 Tax=Paenibacillus harenae TaxID=306543 RepID=UPI000413011F|nr:hypothetical protein [Paenibacillus harenae]
MKLSDIIDEVNKDIDDELDDGYIIGWINRAIDDISPFANHQQTSTISLIADQKAYPKPTDLIKVVMLVDETGSTPQGLYELPIRDFTSCGYKVIGQDIVIQPTPKEPKSLSLYYEARLPHLSLPDDVPVIRSDFHDLLVLYAVARARYQDEEEGLQVNAMSEYLSRRSQFVYECRKAPMYNIEMIF